MCKFRAEGLVGTMCGQLMSCLGPSKQHVGKKKKDLKADEPATLEIVRSILLKCMEYTGVWGGRGGLQ